MRKTKSKKDFLVPLISGNFYHVYNRTNNRELLFHTDNDRIFFLKRYRQYLSPYVDTYAYCLLDNHFHLLIKTKSLEDIHAHVSRIEKNEISQIQKEFMESNELDRSSTNIIHSQFRRFFISYSTVFNSRYKRNGNLFHRSFNRVKVENENHLIQLVYYINTNAQKHKLVKDFRDYKWSSYHTILSDRSTQLQRANVLNWFEDRKGFIFFHNQEEIFEKGMREFWLEE